MQGMSPAKSPPEQSRSLQGRIASAALITALLVLVVACGLFCVELTARDVDADQRGGRELAQIGRLAAASVLVNPGAAPSAAAVNLALAPLQGAENLVSYVVKDSGGAVVARFDKTPSADRAGARRPSVASIESPIFVRGARVGALEVDFEARDWKSAYPRYLTLALALLFGAAGLGLLAGRWMAGRVVEPIRRLSDVMKHVAASGRLDIRARKSADDEVGRLTEVFNSLLQRLSENEARLRASMQALVEARDAAQDANRLKSEFLANISHEIRTPLNGVLAMVQVMEQGRLEEAQRERLDVVRQSGESLLDVVNDVLDMAQIEAGRLTLDSAPFRPSDIAEAAVAAFTPVAQSKGLALELVIAKGARDYRLGDASRLRQIFNNLISNGLKFTPTGWVRLELSQDADGALCASVADTGIGVARDKAALLFQKFVQIDPSSTRTFGGTGLGLAICADLCALMGGKIWADVDRKVGAAFHLRLPLERAETAPEEIAAQDDAPSAAPALTPDAAMRQTRPVETPTSTEGPIAETPDPEDVEAPLRILAAEDNTTNRLVLEAMISILGYSMDIVVDGQAAVEAWSTCEYDVILMDIQMPVMDGITATREIRAREAASGRRRTPVIAVSANAMTHQVAEYLAVGMDAHVAKPIELARLHGAILSVLESAAAEVPSDLSASA